MKKELMEVADTFCKDFCKFRPENGGLCVKDCPLEKLKKYIQEGNMNIEKKWKRILAEIEFCDNVQNDNDESPDIKKGTKVHAYDRIRKIIKEEEND